MAIIHMNFKENDPDDMTTYKYLQSLGRKKRSVLLKILAKKVIEKYPFLFDRKHASSLLEILENSSLVPNVIQQASDGFVPIQNSPFTGKKRQRWA